jgi:MFS transporter, UMF1 family
MDHSTQAAVPSKINKKGFISWALFDFSNSAYVTIIATFIFGPYFIHSVAKSTIIGTRDWAWTIAAAGVIVAIVAPFLGATVDQMKRRKPMLFLLCLLTVISSALLFFTEPSKGWICWAIIFVGLATIGFELMQVLYNAMLYSISPKDKIGRFSGWGWSCGYFGGIICLIIALLVFVKGGFIPKTNSLNVRSTVLFVAGWLIVFYIPLFIWTPDQKRSSLSISKSFTTGIKALGTNYQYLKKMPSVFVYLIAHLAYTDGLNTLFTFFALFAIGTYHFSIEHVIILAIASNIMAGLGAVVLAWVDDWMGPKFNTCLALIGFIILVLIIFFSHSGFYFWILAICASFFVGPIQASSRSFMVHIVPEELNNQLFGFYALSGKITAFIGPFFVGLFTVMFHSQRMALILPIALLIAGLLVLFFVPSHQKIKTRISAL